MTEARRSGPWGAVALVAGLAAMGGGAAWRAAARPSAPPLGPAAAAARGRIDMALASQARALEADASNATRIPELQAALNMGADRDTFQDLLENEEWWAPLRKAHGVTGVVAASGPLAMLGPGTSQVAAAEAVRIARQNGIASGIVAGDGSAFALAAARVIQAKPADASPVVVVGAILDQSALVKISQSTGDALGLSDGTRLVEAAGPGEPGRVLVPLVGHEARVPLLIEDGREATAWPLGGGMWMLAAFAPPHVPPPVPNPAALLLIIGGAVVAMGGIVLFALRPARPGGTRRSSPRASMPVQGAEAKPVRGASSPGGELGATVPEAPAATWPQTRAMPPTGGHGRETARSGGDRGHFATPDRPRPGPGGLALAQANAQDQRAGSEMGRYHLIERIGEGGMAEIFFAAAYGAEAFVRYFVVKRMHSHLARHREAVNQFIDEAQLQARLVHSNIVPVFDFGKAGNEYFLALEYIHGKDLGQFVQAHLDHFGRPLGTRVAFYVLHEVLEALAFAHSQVDKDGTALDIVHRDVAPGNVLLSYRGEVKLTDFGIAKAENRVSHTDVGMVKGNANFMSPEQARGEGVDHRSDIFSAGLVLYFCLTGQPLYRGESGFNQLLRAAVGPATAQFGQIGMLEPVAAEVLRRALAVDPTQRYDNAAIFARDVTEHAGTRGELLALIDAVFPAGARRDLR